ncbi:hypothetical protein [Deminuibacter soli]|uniref:Uncharacterized protein n=1 Tax=Deminuibacter soli TaxID=2291815 RepID=A0A3E1NE23_9BACT|nr:hypothetical protein [Deminuibacter soli]RFM26127.1 hypothetical protein DXN05_21205 [Deminuibacter soli]
MYKETKKRKLTTVNISNMPGLDNIQIPDTLLAALYKDTLIAHDNFKQIAPDKAKTDTAPAPEKPPVAMPTPSKWFLGDNARGIVLLVNDAENVYLADDSLQLLSGILAACKLNLADVAIVNTAHIGFTYQQIKEQTKTNYFFLFNVPAPSVKLAFDIPHYQVQQFDNCTFLTAPDLRALLGTTPEAKLEKSKLWLSLKKIFNL